MTGMIPRDEVLNGECFSAYEIDAVVFYGDPTRIYRARRRSNDTKVMLKTLRDESAAREAAALLQHEYEVAQRLKVPSVVQVYAIKRHNNLPVIELEDFGGDSLDNIARQRRLSIEELLQIAVQVAQGLIDIHGANIMHKDINPSNIVYNAETGVAKIIDFGISTYLTREQAALTSAEVFEGSLPYISPEQTGRMNRSIDYRTDFYSLGVTLYELLTGRPLFIVSEPIEWFHCHIAKQPVPVDEINPNIPRPLSEIVMKLLAKTAEDRYQSARGIQADLAHCLEEWRKTGNVESFPLGKDDLSDRFQISQRLYGRDREVTQLLNNFEKVGRGECKLILVSGYSGIGKTCLIKEIYKPITERNGHFVSGKFDQLNRSVPYSAFSAALRDLVRQLLTEPEAKLAEWRNKILNAVGENGQLMINIIRELELIIGPQPKVAEISPVEAEQRFHRVFLNFIQVFCQSEHPLVMFLDDLQWADSASMKLLELLTLGQSGTAYLLLIGAYRDNEVPESHPVALWLKEMREGKVSLDEIRLRPLTLDNLAELIADSLGAQLNATISLAQIVSQKTAGNPFFTEEFLKALHQEDLIYFSRTQQCWAWDMERISVQKMTDNVVDLMTSKLMRLPADARQLLELGACFGFRFPLSLLAVVSEESPAVVVSRLQEGISAGLIAPIGDAYQLLELEQTPDVIQITVELAFAHDRIHQAAYSLMNDQRRAEVHLKIGRLLRSHLSPVQQQDRLFEIANHMNMGAELIKEPQERNMLCRLNLTAGQRAKASNAYQPAFNYFQDALKLVDDTIWRTDYAFALELHEESAEAAYLTGAYQIMDQLIETGLNQAKELLDKSNFYLVHISACMARGQLLEAINIAKPVLRQLGHPYPEKPNKLHLIGKLLKLKRCLRGKSMEDLRNLPLLTDPKQMAAETIGQRMSAAAMFAQPLLLPLMILNSVQIAVEHGLSPIALTSLAAYGMILAESLGDADRGIAYGQLAMQLMERVDTKGMKGRIVHVYNAIVRHWKEPVHNSLEGLHEAFCLCLEAGDYEYAAHAVVVRQAMAFETGMELNQLLKESAEYHAMLKPLKQGPRIHHLEGLLQKIENLLGNSEDPIKLKGRYYDIDRMLPLHEESGDRGLIGVDITQQMLLGYLFGDYHNTLILNDKMMDSGIGGQGMYHVVPIYLQDALVRLANVRDANKAVRRRLLRKVGIHITKLKRLAKMNPANCLNKLRLAEAERLRVLGREFEAHGLYDESIRLAREQGFVHEEALANELCGGMHLNAGRFTIGEPYLVKARDLYNHWGAQAKVKDLEMHFPQLVQRVQSKGHTTSWGTPQASVDIGSLIKALKAIAEETVHSKMVETIIVTALEFAGAQQGLLLLRNPKGELRIEADACVDCGNPSILQSIPVAAGKLSQAVVNYVTRTRSSIVVHDAQQPCDQIPGLNQDPHIQETLVRSLLCLPILTGNKEKSEMIGMLYLENNRASGTFTQERFDILEVICLSAAGRLELSRKAVIDGLTELYNHDYFQNILNQEFSSARRHGQDLSLVLIDIDHFKRFNDTWGHQVGDQVLRDVAQAIKSNCRNGDTVARYGGEEMVVILPMARKDKAEAVAERIRAAVENHRVDHNGEKLQVTISLGLACLDNTMADKDVLIRRADTALYRSKADGRNRLTVA